MEGRTFLVTGASSGIGRALAEALAAGGANVVLASRSEERTMPLLQGIRSRFPGRDVSFLKIDVSELASVRQAAAAFLAAGRQLDVLVNNAGIAGTNALTSDGFDLTYATNHIGPFLLTSLLLPKLRESGEARIVNVASQAHMRTTHVDWSMLSRLAAPRRGGFADYAATKLMNILHAKELARRLAGTTVGTYALHPGVVATDIWRAVPKLLQAIMKLFMLSSEKGARTPLYCATAPELRGKSGRYYDACRERTPSLLAQNEALARELWERTERLVT